MKAFLTVTIVAVASMGGLALAQAQVVVPPGQDFYATPMSSGVSMPVGRIVTEAPAPAKKAKKRRTRR